MPSLQWNLDDAAPELAFHFDESLNFASAAALQEALPRLRKASHATLTLLACNLRGGTEGHMADSEAIPGIYRTRQAARAIVSRFPDLPEAEAWLRAVEAQVDAALQPYPAPAGAEFLDIPPDTEAEAQIAGLHQSLAAYREAKADPSRDLSPFIDGLAESIRKRLAHQARSLSEPTMRNLEQAHLLTLFQTGSSADFTGYVLPATIETATRMSAMIEEYHDRQAQTLPPHTDAAHPRDEQDYLRALRRMTGWIGHGAPEWLEERLRQRAIHAESAAGAHPDIVLTPYDQQDAAMGLAPHGAFRDHGDPESLNRALRLAAAMFVEDMAVRKGGMRPTPEARAAFAEFAVIGGHMAHLFDQDRIPRDAWIDAYSALETLQRNFLAAATELHIESVLYHHLLTRPGTTPWTGEALQYIGTYIEALFPGLYAPE